MSRGHRHYMVFVHLGDYLGGLQITRVVSANTRHSALQHARLAVLDEEVKTLAAKMRAAVDSHLPEDEPNDVRDWVYERCAHVVLDRTISVVHVAPTKELCANCADRELAAAEA